MVGGQDDGQPGGHHGLHVLAPGVDDLFTPHLMRECLGLAVMLPHQGPGGLLGG